VRSARPNDDEGAGLIGSIAGVTVFLAFLMFATQLLMNLHTTSMVTSAAHEAARSVAGSGHGAPGSATAQAAGEQRARLLLGQFGQRVEFDWSATTADEVVLRVRADTLRFTLPGLPAALGFDEVDRTVRARVETVR
jgi:hypothetical protein